MLRHDDLQLWPISDVETGAVHDGDAAAMRRIAAWSRDFLVPEHSDLGRDGPVCPFTKTSMKKDLFFLTTLRTRDPAQPVEDTINSFGDWYRDLAASASEDDRKFLTFLIVLPDVELVDSTGLDDLQRRLKTRFVQDGLMIGQFHPACDQPGIWNDAFRPLRSPIPLLAIRAMVQYDLPFLMGAPEHLDAYLSRFAPGIPPHLRSQLAAAVGYMPSPHERVA